MERQHTLASRHEAAVPQRKARGVYYTPPELVAHVVEHTLGPIRGQRSLHILDPACGCGAFLEACQALAPGQHLYGVDLDAQAVGIASRLVDPGGIRVGDALLGIDWAQEFPQAPRPGGFDAVVGNPPWGQKAIDVDDERKRLLWQRYPSSAGIFDWFRPFVELGVQLLRPGGRFGMVLPDVVLLKDYEATRRFLLDHLALERIEWWGQAFTAATIDVATIIGTKRPAAGQRVFVAVHNPDRPLSHSLPQDEFRVNPRCVFNLHLSTERRRVLEQLANCPRLGDWFEIHEGVHSGNIRAELFVDRAVDASCRPLWFGRDEIAPYQLRWAGRYIRLGAAPARRTPQRYANLGRRAWHERAKLLVRRTGDRVLAAVDRAGRHASNNFFLVFPKRAGTLDLDGLCAMLNSRLLTWYFRAIEPRQGRAFAELKIKHLRTFPLPAEGHDELNRLGRRCAQAEEPGPLQVETDRLVLQLFELTAEPG